MIPTEAGAALADEPERGSPRAAERGDRTAERRFEFHGVRVAVRSADPAVLDHVAHDFSYFAVDGGGSLETPSATAGTSPRLTIDVVRERPDYDSLPVMRASIATPRNITFQSEGRVYVDYFGRALNVYDPRAETATVTTEDADLAREIVYLTILSRASALLERRGIHRIHALGLEKDGKGALVTLPSGGGKSTLALSILLERDSGIRLISEDSPLIRRDGWLLPFPVRLGVHPEQLPEAIDRRYVRVEKRMEFHSKMSVDVAYFADRLVHVPVRPAAILLGTRTTSRETTITPVPPRRVLRHLLMNSVVGVGLYQGMEFIFQSRLLDVAAHAGTALSRAWNAGKLLRHARVYEFSIGRDRERNRRELVEFLTHRL